MHNFNQKSHQKTTDTITLPLNLYNNLKQLTDYVNKQRKGHFHLYRTVDKLILKP